METRPAANRYRPFRVRVRVRVGVGGWGWGWGWAERGRGLGSGSPLPRRPDVRSAHPGLRSLEAGYAPPSWLRLPPTPAPGQGRPLTRFRCARTRAGTGTGATPHAVSLRTDEGRERGRGDHSRGFVAHGQGQGKGQGRSLTLLVRSGDIAFQTCAARYFGAGGVAQDSIDRSVSRRALTPTVMEGVRMNVTQSSTSHMQRARPMKVTFEAWRSASCCSRRSPSSCRPFTVHPLKSRPLGFRSSRRWGGACSSTSS